MLRSSSDLVHSTWERERPRASCADARSASACRTDSWNSRASYSASTCPALTRSPRSTSSLATVPGCSVFAMVSCQATTLPTVSTARWTSRASAFVTVIGTALTAGAPPRWAWGACASDFPQAAASSNASGRAMRATERGPMGGQFTLGWLGQRVLDRRPQPVVRYESMAIQRTPMTRAGYDRLKAELDRLKKQRPLLTKPIREARAHGDLSQNVQHHPAREKQSFIEARI